jgi:hypothetical protein
MAEAPWIDHTSKMIPTKLMMKIREGCSSEAELTAKLAALSEEEIDRFGGAGELKIRYRVKLAEENTDG